MFTLVKVRRLAALLLFSLLTVVSTYASPFLQADESVVCPGYPIFFSASGFNSSGTRETFYWEKSSDKTTWTVFGTTMGELYASADMDDKATMYYRVRNTQNEISNVVTVKLNTDKSCEKVCHVTTTGDFFDGTDFDPVGQADTAHIPNGVVNYFSENNIVFASAGISNYKITGDVTSFFGGYTPQMDGDITGSNYYYVVENPNARAYSVAFPANENVGKTYRFVMRMYVKVTPGCNQCWQAMIQTRTGHGRQSSDYLECSVYDDVADTLIGTVGMAATGDDPHVNVGQFFCGRNQYQLYRIEVTYYGKFPNGSNGLSYFTFYPELSQFNCTKVAIDYISAETASICMDNGTKCVGQSTTVNAAGFPRNANYVWEHEVNGVWTVLNVGGIEYSGPQYKAVNIPVESVNKEHYRVRDDNSDVVEEFYIVGRDCDGVNPDTIIGSAVACAPATEVYTVDPVEGSSSYSYLWKLYNPSGKEINDKTVIYESADRGVSITIKIPNDPVNYPSGNYKLTVQMVKTNSLGVSMTVGELVEKTIEVHARPTSSFTLTGLNSDGTICPSNIHTTLQGVADDATMEKYAWVVNKTTNLSENPATIEFTTSVQQQLCAGTLSYLPVSLTVTDKYGCTSTTSKSIEVKTGDALSINCKSLKNISDTLAAREKIKTVSLPVPSITTSCESNPKVVITGTGTLSDGTAYTFSKEAFYQDITSGVADMNIKVAATSPAGITVTYTASDACNTSTCSINVKVVDVTAPDVSCDQIPSYVAHTSNYSGCEAVPGENAELPKLAPVVLTDLNGVDGKITGVYMGRWEKCPTENPKKDEIYFDKTIALNAAFPVGVNFVLWAYTDKSGNTTYCTQRVQVIDDVPPVADCPAETLLHVSTDPEATTCGTSLKNVLASFEDLFESQGKYPSAQDQCSSTASIDWTKARHFYRKSTATDWTEVTDQTAMLFEEGVTYDLAWRFYKTATGTSIDKTVYASCEQQFMVDDSVPPTAPCEQLRDTAVTINIGNNTDWVYTYASGKGSSSTTVYTLAGFFKSIPNGYDVCDGKSITPVVTVETPDGTITTIKNLSALQSFRFPKATTGTTGLSIVKYTYTDSKGNSSFCEQYITVYDKEAPVIEGCQDSIVLYANDKCEGVWNFATTEIPTATVYYNSDIRYKGYYPYLSSNGWWSWTYATEKDVVLSSETEFYSLNPIKDSTGLKTLTPVYPVKVVKITNVDANGNETAASVKTEIKAPLGTEVGNKVVWHRGLDYYDPNYVVDLKKQVLSSITLQTNNFKASAFNTAFKTFEKGRHKVMWIFDNGEGMQDTCSVPIIVKDSTAPTLKCGDWDKDLVLYADDNCEVPAKEANITQPTLESLEATDNCTSVSDLKLTWKRENPDKTVIKDITKLLNDPFTVGETTITWTVTDADGNASNCIQVIDVKDTLGPVQICDDVVKMPSIEVYADENCEVLPANINGLSTPYAPDDQCSPTGDVIEGKGVRYFGSKADGKDILKDAYPLGVTIIKWTFTDAQDNKSVCEQVITVKDTTRPYPAMCDSLRKNPIIYELPSDACELSLDELKKHFGKYYATDNCSDTPIEGIPYLKQGDLYVSLPESFKKDNTYEIAWIFADKVKNQEVCVQELEVRDTTPPDTTGICPDPYKEMDALTSCSFGFNDLDLPELTINDKCDGKLVGVLTGVIAQPAGVTVYAPEQAQFADLQYYTGTHHFTWTFTDKAGLTSTCKMDLKINDKTPPVIDNCDIRQADTMAMSSGVCYAKLSDVMKLLVVPRAHDVCEDSMRGSEYPLDPYEIQRWQDGVMIAGGDTSSWRVNEIVPLGKTMLVWKFRDSSDNESECAKTVVIVSKTEPDFDCDQINPDTLTPQAKDGECSVPYAEINLNQNYWGTNACTGDSILAQISVGAGPTIIKPTVFELLVGKTYELFWVVRDQDGNTKACPQWIEPHHNNKINYDCSQLPDSVVVKAVEGTCGIPASEVGLTTPYTYDSCLIANGITPDIIYAVGQRSDSLSMTDDYPTGTTTVKWMFVSPYNPTDTSYCMQVVDVKGNKHFEINCDTVCPEMRDTVDDCGPSQILTAVAPWVGDPCISDSSDVNFRRYGVGTRSDGLALTEPFALGTTTVKWVFTDFTQSIKDSCYQKFVVLTTKLPQTPCRNAAMDTIKHEAPEGDACVIPSEEIALDTPVVVNPCTGDTLITVMQRPGLSDLSSPYSIGINEILWIFQDTTGTLVKEADTCVQFVKIGDVDVKPVDCKDFPDQDITLDEGDCSIDFGEIALNIPEVWDRCPNGKASDPVQIKPTITRSSMPAWSTDDPAQIGSFGLGTDYISWSYNISGVDYLCKQRITVKDSVEPNFDCNQLEAFVKVQAPTGTCTAPLDTVLKNFKTPNAYDSCLPDLLIPGVLTLADGTALPETFAVGDTFHLRWTFIDTTINKLPKYCYQDLLVISDMAPIFDCNSLDTLKFTAYDACQTDLTMDSIPVPEALDYCTKTKVPGVGTLMPYEESIVGTYALGFHTIRWIFTSPFSSVADTCEQIVWVRTDREINGHCDELQDTIKVDVEDGVCQVPASLVNIPAQHMADVPCHTYQLSGVPSRGDGMAMTDSFPVGITVVTWTFTDTTKTLLNPVSTCTQYVQVGDKNTPLLDCKKSFPDTTIALKPDICSVNFDEIHFNIDEMPVNTCNNDTATLDTSRESGKLLTDPYEVGTDYIIWTFTFQKTKQPYYCRQQITVIDTSAPIFDCSQLKSPLVVPLTTEAPSVPYSDVVAAGFYVPVVVDACSEVTTKVTRSDNQNYDTDYPFGQTTVYFEFSDKYGNVKQCEQVINVTDMIPIEPTCPNMTDSYACMSDVPAAYATLEEFKAAGGTLSDETKVKADAFTHTETIVGDECAATITRTYIFYDLRNGMSSCQQVITMKDSIAPTWAVGTPSNNFYQLSCSDEVPEFPVYTATDNCSEATVTYTDASNRSSDPKSCDYYSYDLVRTYVATDACGNSTAPITFTYQVRDMSAPVVDLPEGWSDEKVVSVYLKGCHFGVPDVTDLLPEGSVTDNCVETEDLTIWQSPKAGDTIYSSMYVTLYIQDICGNITTAQKLVYVPTRENIVSMSSPDRTICGNDENTDMTLISPHVRDASGYIWIKENGVWDSVSSTIFFDCYRDSICPKNIVYSNNPTTYKSLFDRSNKDEFLNLRYQLTKLTRRSQSGRYFFVGMDTATFCTDTSSAYLNIIERPRVTLDASTFSVCENDSLPLDEMANRFNVCVNDMGSAVTDEGWILDSTKYTPNTLITAQDSSLKVQYYATNECGTTFSAGSLFSWCYGSDPETTADSLALAGSMENLELWRKDEYYSDLSLELDVHLRYNKNNILLTTDPQDKARVWAGDNATLVLNTPYAPDYYYWYKVVGDFDGRIDNSYTPDGEIKDGMRALGDDDDELLVRTDTLWNSEEFELYALTDSSKYYVLISDGVCPAVASNIVSIDVMNQLPTAITPYTKDGMNDVFMAGHKVLIFNRYGQTMYEGSNGWDGTYRGMLVDPGVYFYEVEMNGGITFKGTVEVVKIQ